MDVRATTDDPPATNADTIVVGIFDGKGVPHDVEDGTLGALVESGEARPGFRKLAVAHAAGKRWILIGLGERDEFDHERARIAAATALGRARELGARVLCWELPHKVADDVPGALVEGTLLAAYRYSAVQVRPGRGPRPGGADRLGPPRRRGRRRGGAGRRGGRQPRARPRQHPGQRADARGARRPGARAAGRDRSTCSTAPGIRDAGMGAFAAVAQGAAAEPQLITIRHEPAGAAGPLLGLVGKAVTFDTGGYSIKPAARMHEMKFDMCGGAAVLEAIGAVAELGLPVRIAGVIGATENMVDAKAVRPGDIVRSRAGITIEINNTDAEGRLVLADCLTHARELGAEKLVDVATLTGGIVTTFGPVHAGLMGTDDAWCDAIAAAGEATGERVWRLPLDPLYDDMIKGSYGDIMNAVEGRKAHSITAAAFLARFAGDVPWAHLDIAGVSDGLGRAYAAKGASGWGVRLLVELVRAQA